MQGAAASSDVLGALRKLAETVAEDVYKRLKYTWTPLHTAQCHEAGKALLELGHECRPIAKWACSNAGVGYTFAGPCSE